MDHLDAMKAFVAVATLGSFAEAARRLRISPSAVTRSVAQLEDRLGLTLFNRTTRSVRLTERGQIYLESSRRILEDLDAAERQALGEDAEPRGVLHVAAPIVFGRLHVLPMVLPLLTDHPALTVRLTLSDRNVHLVDEGVHVALRIGDLADSSLTAVKLGAVSRVLVASPAYLAAHGSPSRPADLEDHALIAFEGLEARLLALADLRPDLDRVSGTELGQGTLAAVLLVDGFEDAMGAHWSLRRRTHRKGLRADACFCQKGGGASSGGSRRPHAEQVGDDDRGRGTHR